MNILFISYFFAPNNVVASVRATKLAERLARNGHNVDVVTYGGKRDKTYPMPKGIRNVYTMTPYVDDDRSLGKNKDKLKVAFRNSKNFFIRVLKKCANWYFGLFSDRKALKRFKEIYKTELKSKNYDAVFSTYGPLSSLLCGLYFNKKRPQVKWICDFRDPVVGETTPFRKRLRGYRLQSKACKRADKIVAVSNGYIEKICGDRFKEKRYMISNGYDLADKECLLTTSKTPLSKLTLVYVGALYNGKRDLSVLFKAISQLLNERQIDIKNIALKYAGNDSLTLRAQAEKYGLENIIQDNGRISRVECLRFQYDAHLLLLCTWNTKKDKGIFPGKFLEYMLIGKPIVSITTGEIANSEVSSVMKEGNLGIAYEQANDDKDFTLLKEYILSAYNQFIDCGEIKFSPNKEIVDRYNYDSIIKRLEELL